MKYEERTYRSLINKENLQTFHVKIEESDLLISSDTDLTLEASNSLSRHRHHLQEYIRKHPDFRTSLLPLPADDMAPPVVRDMLEKTNMCGVGPMASVAGAVSEFVGHDLLSCTKNIIIENGGDIFVKSERNLTASVFAGESPLSYKINFAIKSDKTPRGICTSSATVGPSLSFGKADAVCVISGSATLADAAASAVGNRVKSKKDIKNALDYGIKIPGINAIIVISQGEVGIIGEIDLI